MRDNQITIGFSYEDTYGDMYNSESVCEISHDYSNGYLDVIGRQLNVFLKQCGFPIKNDYIFMESLSKDELQAVTKFLNWYREDKPDNNNIKEGACSGCQS